MSAPLGEQAMRRAVGWLRRRRGWARSSPRPFGALLNRAARGATPEHRIRTRAEQ
ncbi:hypothetical protein ACGFY9_09115 [Streptomyces sp. NPDC048504]|uniref:hypothetical protein n=1 Tax=Streptomyces sp. NPDC048504 TaxID=3365559 RepID=UPI003723892D